MNTSRAAPASAPAATRSSTTKTGSQLSTRSASASRAVLFAQPQVVAEPVDAAHQALVVTAWERICA